LGGWEGAWLGIDDVMDLFFVSVFFWHRLSGGFGFAFFLLFLLLCFL